MRKKYIIALLALSALVAAIPSSAQTRRGFEAAFNYTSLSMKQDLITVDYVPGVKAGFMIETIFPGVGFGLNTGIYYSLRGAKLHLGEKTVWAADGYGDERAYLHYIEIPFHLRFKWTRMNGLEDYVAPFAYGGPTLGLMVAHNKCDALQYAFGEVGMTAGIGFEICRRWQLAGSYTWGLTYALKTAKLDNFSGRNRQLSVGLTYFF
ncbi:MAG: PorT family protein [Muribaculaceae bacterium]|nr:PorT family protein [Muribaculaceae bacterium]MBR4721785.1 PorT family protein [Muribaculaceae bacterium]MBR5745143.1 PorT family protein [Muribaculaceae bacterium]